MAVCNWCALQQIREIALRDKLAIACLGSNHPLGGVDIYLHPWDVEVMYQSDSDGELRRKYFVCWMMHLPGVVCTCESNLYEDIDQDTMPRFTREGDEEN